MIATYSGRDGPVQIDLKVDKKTGLFVRPGTSDQKMLREAAIRDYSTVDCRGHLCLDLGGNVGGFILKAAQEGAWAVTSFEPEPQNYAILKENAEAVRKRYPFPIRINTVEAAVSDKTGTFDLTISPGTNSPCSASLTTKVSHGRHTVPVQVHAIREVLQKYRPTLVKMDIEGAEYAVLDEPMPDFVQEMAIEFHGFTKKNRALMQLHLQKLRDQGWTFVHEKSKKIFAVVSLVTVHVKRC